MERLTPWRCGSSRRCWRGAGRVARFSLWLPASGPLRGRLDEAGGARDQARAAEPATRRLCANGRCRPLCCRPGVDRQGTVERGPDALVYTDFRGRRRLGVRLRVCRRAVGGRDADVCRNAACQRRALGELLAQRRGHRSLGEQGPSLAGVGAADRALAIPPGGANRPAVSRRRKSGSWTSTVGPVSSTWRWSGGIWRTTACGTVGRWRKKRWAATGGSCPWPGDWPTSSTAAARSGARWSVPKAAPPRGAAVSSSTGSSRTRSSSPNSNIGFIRRGQCSINGRRLFSRRPTTWPISPRSTRKPASTP